MNRIELLAPAGDLQKLKFALAYGADAVYCAGEIFGLRAGAKNFTTEELAEGVEYAHNMGKRVFLTLNIIPHNEDLDALKAYLESISHIPIDAFILSDPGTLLFVKEMRPEVEVHLSTQANNTNYLSAKFWQQQGVKRVILARELSFAEIAETVQHAPEGLELESFVHGAMCISYSGRCLLSNYMADRDANRGECAHPCRWKYALVEEKRPGEYYPVEENERGTFFFNSKDLCMIEHIPELIESGLASLKIEGRMKSLHYVANVVRVYRMALDAYYANPEGFVYDPQWMDEIKKASHREFTTGFYYNKPKSDDQIYSNSTYIREYDFTGIVKSYDPETKLAVLEQRGRMFVGEELEIIGPGMPAFNHVITEMYDGEMNPIEVAPHPQMTIIMRMEQPVGEYFILRRPKE